MKNSFSFHERKTQRLGDHFYNDLVSSRFLQTGRKIMKVSNDKPKYMDQKLFQSLHLEHSIVNLQDSSFIDKQISVFEERLPKNSRFQGFSEKARQKSILLGTTEGYRSYKKNNYSCQNMNKIQKQNKCATYHSSLHQNSKKNIIKIQKSNDLKQKGQQYRKIAKISKIYLNNRKNVKQINRNTTIEDQQLTKKDPVRGSI